MLVKDLSFENLPQIKLSDKVGYVLELLYQFQIQALPLTDDGKFAGIISEEELLSADDHLPVSDVQKNSSRVAVSENDHFLKAVMIAASSQLPFVPVTDVENKLLAVVTTDRLLSAMSSFMQLDEPGAIIVLEQDAIQYSFSEICRLVESNDAQITQLNTRSDIETQKVSITIKINRQEVSDLVATFQRHDFNVKYYFGEELYANELKNNYDNLIHYLNI
ncbi:MAG TPA: CBS domain-containing protein [Niabella sp.]|nr:CBS domain-containing protein [Niabella sp.]HOZ95872.1 CBS domain-containing protein [Niabella sp.]HQW15784.1 CBS domain-containing protein [Niabella sp.]HQX20924.1 CBS domain-containing protein [Niabella sp.]HQX41432.1 CBS domain-containing protein [Niabella sp.]